MLPPVCFYIIIIDIDIDFTVLIMHSPGHSDGTKCTQQIAADAASALRWLKEV